MLDRVVKIYKILSSILFPSEIQKTVKKWYADNGESSFRVEYDLNGQSIVFDLGGYEGQWSSDIFAMYCCNIFVFEPVKQYSEKMKHRFERNPKIKVYDYGLGKADGTCIINVQKDGSSLHRGRGNEEEIKLVDAASFINNYDIDKINLIKINIEGAEYDLLEHLIKSKIVEHIENIQIQFHDFVENAEIRMRNIQKNLSLTHELTYQYKFVWENWKRKPVNSHD